MADLTPAEQARVDRANALDAAYQRGERCTTLPNGDQVLVTEAAVRRAREIAAKQYQAAAAREHQPERGA